MEATKAISDNNNKEGLLTRDEACKFLKINPCTLWKLTRDGKVSYYRVGRKMFFIESELLENLKVNKSK